MTVVHCELSKCPCCKNNICQKDELDITEFWVDHSRTCGDTMVYPYCNKYYELA
jgi:hypothetical protein